MGVEIKKVVSRRDLNSFIRLAFDIYRDDPTWAPDLLMDTYDKLNRKKHPFFKHANAEYFLAYKDGKVVGRIAAVDNPNHNSYWKDKVGFWGMFACINDQETANALFDAARDWLKNRGKDTMRGPFSFSTNDELGMLFETDGSHRYPIMPHNPMYYMDLCDKYGMQKAKDLIAFYLDLTKEINPKVLRIANHLKEKAEEKGLTIRHLNRKQLRKDIKTVMNIYHDAWKENWGFVPLTDVEFDSMPETLAMITDDSLVTIVEDKKEPVAMAVAVYDIMEVTFSLRRLDRCPLWYIYIRQVMRLVWRLFIKPKNKFKRGRLLLAGVKPGYRKMGLDAFLYTLPFQAGKILGLTDAELSWELEDNEPIKRAIVKMGGEVYKKFRVWDMKI
jgi:hypothetical protein